MSRYKRNGIDGYAKRRRVSAMVVWGNGVGGEIRAAMGLKGTGRANTARNSARTRSRRRGTRADLDWKNKEQRC
jgi:hypothetical protein